VSQIQQEQQQEEKTYPTTAHRNTDISKLTDNGRDPNYSIYPVVVIHNDDNQLSVCSSACSISTHSTITTQMVTQPSYCDVERSLIKDEHSAKTQSLQVKAITSCACFRNEAYWKALLLGCFFELTLRRSNCHILLHILIHFRSSHDLTSLRQAPLMINDAMKKQLYTTHYPFICKNKYAVTK